MLFFDDKAKKAAADLTKGEIVTVVSYKHTAAIKSALDWVRKAFDALQAGSLDGEQPGAGEETLFAPYIKCRWCGRKASTDRFGAALSEMLMGASVHIGQTGAEVLQPIIAAQSYEETVDSQEFSCGSRREMPSSLSKSESKLYISDTPRDFI